MVKRIIVVLAFALLVTPVMAADFSIGLRWNYIAMFEQDSFWDTYVAEKGFDESPGDTDPDPEIIDNTGAVDDYNGFNALPAVKVSLRFGSIKVDAIDLEYYDRERRITNYTNDAIPGIVGVNWQEWMTLNVIQVRHSVAYVIEHKEFDFYLGGGINWGVWETDSRVNVTEYTGSQPYDTTKTTYSGKNDGIAFGAHLTAGTEFALTESVAPFVGITYMYQTDTWDTPDEFFDAYNRHADSVVLSPELEDSYDISFSGLRIDFGLMYRF